MEKLKEIYEGLINFLYQYLYKTGVYPFILLGMVFAFILFIAIKYNPTKQLKNAYNGLNQRLIERSNAAAYKNKKKFNFNRIHDTLLQNGILFRLPWLDNPANYISFKIILGIVAGFLFSLVYPIFFILGFLLGYKSLDFLVYIVNAEDNKKMQNDIQLIYNLILIQSKSHINLTYALCDCIDMIDPDDVRLRVALKQLKVNLFSGYTFKNAIKLFNENFNNQYIDSLCLTLIQVEETGLAADLLRDINNQVQHFSSLQLSKKKDEMDIKVTIASLLFLSATLAIGIGAGFIELSESLQMTGLF